MKETDKNQQRINLPPAWCGGICRNAMNQVCVEDCARKRDCSHFELRRDIGLIDLPRFPLEQTESMTKEEKFTVVTVYLAKVVDHLSGVDNGPSPISHQTSKAIAINKVIVDAATEFQSLENDFDNDATTSDQSAEAKSIENKEKE